ncbi:MAG: hypothetical protein ACI4PH_08175 [Faecousia sp.]
MTDGEMLYQKFRASSQEPVRLELALQGFFLEEADETPRQEFANYLKRRIRPAAEALIKADDLPKLQTLEELGWLNANLVEDCLEMAIRLKKTQAFLWLLGVKAEKYGFPDRNFDL